MTNKITTEDAQSFLHLYYKNKNIVSNFDDWTNTKKYKNPKGLLCRDFFNKEINVKAIVIGENKEDILKVIENENYEYFLKQLAETPLFYYVPTICNDGLIFIFESVKTFETTGKLSVEHDNIKKLLKSKLLVLFREEDLLTLEDGMFFAFPNIDMDEAIRRLERSQMTFNIKLFDAIDTENFQPIIPDVSLAIFSFFEDEKLSQEKAIDKIFEILSTKKELELQDYARIKFLLKRIQPTEFYTVKKIGVGFRSKKDNKLISIFESENNRKKAQELVKKIWLEKTNNT